MGTKGSVMQALYFGADEKAPQIGDTKISFEKIVLPEVSIVGMQDGDSLTKHTTQNGYTLFLLAAGRESKTSCNSYRPTHETVMPLRCNWSIK